MQKSQFSKVSIIILNYNCWKDTVESIESVLKNDYPNFEIIVVDNKSSDDSLERLKKWLFDYRNRTFGKDSTYDDVASQMILVQNSINNGFAGGNNLGIKIGRERGADYFLILNPDVEVKKNFLSELVKYYEVELPRKAQLHSQKIGFLGPRIFYYHNRNLIYSNGGKINWSLTRGELIDNAQDARMLKLLNAPLETDYVSGTALFVSKDVLDDIGLMDESFFLYYEDTEWALRASKKGYKHFIIPTSIIYHKESVSTGKFSYNYIYYHTRNALIMARKHGNIFIKIHLIFFIIQKALKQIFKLIFMPSKRIFAKAILRGIQDFIKNKDGKLN